MRNIFKLCITLMIAGGGVASAQSANHSIVGAWASGDKKDACDTSPITHFMSDGVVAVFMKKDGELHSFGTWSTTEDKLTMTHNDFPLKGDGISNPLVSLDILVLDEKKFVTTNAEGNERARIRCNDIEITMGHSDHAH